MSIHRPMMGNSNAPRLRRITVTACGQLSQDQLVSYQQHHPSSDSPLDHRTFCWWKLLPADHSFWSISEKLWQQRRRYPYSLGQRHSVVWTNDKCTCASPSGYSLLQFFKRLEPQALLSWESCSFLISCITVVVSLDLNSSDLPKILQVTNFLH